MHKQHIRSHNREYICRIKEIRNVDQEKRNRTQYDCEGIRKNSKKGFIHSTGHGVGLDLHENPRVADNDYELRKGNVITIEPGLYDPEVGGVRLEDMVLVRKNGCENLTKFEKNLMI